MLHALNLDLCAYMFFLQHAHAPCTFENLNLLPLQPCNHESDDEDDDGTAEEKKLFDSEDEEDEDENDGWFDVLIGSSLSQSLAELPLDSQPMDDSHAQDSQAKEPQTPPKDVVAGETRPVARPLQSQVMDEPVFEKSTVPLVVVDSPCVKSKADRIAELQAQLANLQDEMKALNLNKLGVPIEISHCACFLHS